MGNLLFRKISSDIAYFFLIASVSITLIIWVIQSVNYLDIVSEDGYSLKIYFVYSVLSLPKIFSKILIFIYFISCFFIINKYQENNEILVSTILNLISKHKANINNDFTVLVNNGPGSFSTIRVALAAAKGIKISKNVNLFGFKDKDLSQFNLENIEVLIDKNLIEKKLIKPLYLS